MRGPVAAALPVLLALSLFAIATEAELPGPWAVALFWPDETAVPELILHLSAFPRLITAGLAGAVLALSGTLLQRVFLNPIAEASTLGITAGAQCALTLALIHLPGLSPGLRLPFALCGSGIAFLMVLGLARQQGLSALSLILSGLVVSFLFGGLNAVLALFHHDVLQSLFLWQAGSLEQDGWGSAARLALALGMALLLIPLAERPLRLLALGDGGALGLGLRPGRARLLLVLGAVTLAALVTAEVGVLAFLGILAPLLARAFAGREPGIPLIALTGAGVLMLADQLVLALRPLVLLQTGASLALLGSGLLLLLLRKAAMPAPASLLPKTSAPRLRPAPWLWPVLLLVLPLAALSIGRSPEGWDLSFFSMLEWRLPRVLGAAAAGAGFGLAGCLMQRLTGNPLASPELLGISAAAALGLVLAVILAGSGWSSGGRGLLYGATTLGALAGLLLILCTGARRGFSPEGMLLTGLALSMLLSALLAVLLSGGHPLAGQLLTWLSGSTWRIALPDAVLALVFVVLLLGAAMGLRRWLDHLPLGRDSAQSLGVPVTRARGAVVVILALATATGTILTGPLGFIGLIAPALARLLAPPRALAQLPVATLAGAVVMVFADWLGRIVTFPWQIPAGMMALLCGAALLILFLLRRPQ